jgi:hypothetical protein
VQPLLGRNEIKKYTFVVELQIGQVVGKIGEVITGADLHVAADVGDCVFEVLQHPFTFFDLVVSFAPL